MALFLDNTTQTWKFYFCAKTYAYTLVCVCVGGGGGGRVSSYMEVGTNVRPEWPPFHAWKYIYGYPFSFSNIWIPQVF